MNRFYQVFGGHSILFKTTYIITSNCKAQQKRPETGLQMPPSAYTKAADRAINKKQHHTIATAPQN